jgi:hypothetical protein
MKAVSLWAKMDAEAQKLMKDSLLQALVREAQYGSLSCTVVNDACVRVCARDITAFSLSLSLCVALIRKPVRNGIADVVGIVARIVVPSNEWPELLDFLFQCTNSQNVEHREVGMKLFDSLTDNIGDYLRPHTKTLYTIFAKGLTDSDNAVRIASLKCVSSLRLSSIIETRREDAHSLLSHYTGLWVRLWIGSPPTRRSYAPQFSSFTMSIRSCCRTHPRVALTHRKHSAICCRRCSISSATASRTDSTTRAPARSRSSTSSSNR